MTAGVIAAVVTVMAILYAIWWLVDRLLDRATPQPTRVRPPRAEPISLDLPYLHATGEARTRIALARSTNKKAAATSDRPAA